jgi:chemotaxis protein CheX
MVRNGGLAEFPFPALPFLKLAVLSSSAAHAKPPLADLCKGVTPDFMGRRGELEPSIFRQSLMTTPAMGSPNVASSASWPVILQHATAEVFSMMAGVEISAAPDSPAQATGNIPSTTVTGTVGIAGALSAILSFRCSSQCATKIASRMLSVPIAEASPHQCDAIGEICNMAAGNFKAKIGLEDKCMLSVPTVITGGNYQLHAASATHRVELPLVCEGELVWLALEIRG